MSAWDRETLPQESWREDGHVIELAGRQTHFLQGSKPALSRGASETVAKEDAGAAAGPLILVHGFFYDCRMWLPNLEALAGEHEVYALDLWGSGLSCRGRLSFSYDLFVEQLCLFMDALGLEKAAFAGQGMGAGSILHLAATHPQRLERMILIDSAGLPDKLPLTAQLMKSPLIALPLFLAPGRRLRRKILLGHFIGNPEILSNEYFDQITAFQQIKGTARSLLDMLQADFFHSLEESIRKLSEKAPPALIVWGELDESNPLKQGEKLHELLPGSRLVVLPGAGHVANADQPEAFNRLILEFLGE